MSYESKFDPKKPQPGDKELAAAIRKGIEDAKKGREAKLSPQQLERLFERSKEFTSTAEAIRAGIEGGKPIKCACGRTTQSKACWAVGAIWEDQQEGWILVHRPRACETVPDGPAQEVLKP